MFVIYLSKSSKQFLPYPFEYTIENSLTATRPQEPKIKFQNCKINCPTYRTQSGTKSLVLSDNEKRKNIKRVDVAHIAYIFLDQLRSFSSFLRCQVKIFLSVTLYNQLFVLVKRMLPFQHFKRRENRQFNWIFKANSFGFNLYYPISVLVFYKKNGLHKFEKRVI